MEIKEQFKDLPIKDGSQRCPCYQCHQNPILLYDISPSLQLEKSPPKRKRTSSPNKNSKKKSPHITTTTTITMDVTSLPSVTATVADSAASRVVPTTTIDPAINDT